jgi:hypothetical protein
MTTLRHVRPRLALLGTATAFVLAMTVATAAPAEARRNVGGLVPETCVAPGHAVIGNHGPGLGANCICIIETIGNTVVAGPNDRCPPGIVRLQERRDGR